MLTTDPPDVASHYRLVTYCARRWRGRLPDNLTWADFVQEGYLALVMACRDFDPGRGNAFSTFACNRIIRHLRKVLRAATKVVGGIQLHCDVPDVKAEIDADLEAIQDKVWNEVERLDPFAREALIRHYGLDGFPAESFLSTSRSMGCGRMKVAGSVRRSLCAMQARLAGDVA